MTLNFTARTVKTLKPLPGRRVDYFDASLPGLALRVTETGHKSWSVHYRNAERRLRRLTLGEYPTLGLASARKAAQSALRAASGGNDPATEKTARGRGETVAELAAEYIERHAKTKKKSWREDQRMLDADVIPHWGTRKVRGLTRRDVRELIEGIVDRGAPIMANRVLSVVSKMLSFAVQRDWIEANPAARMPKPGAEQSRERVLTDDEIRLVWETCATERPAMCALLRLRLITAQRGGELAQLAWTNVDLDTAWITLPGRSTKNKHPHRVPLSTMALDLLAALPRVSDEWVFPGRSDLRPLGDAKVAGGRVARRVLAELQKTNPDVKTFDFRAHDLRRTASTRMAEAGVSQADIARVLNHAQGGPAATNVYNRYAYDREKRVALDTWARRLAGILAEKSTASVLLFTRGG